MGLVDRGAVSPGRAGRLFTPLLVIVFLIGGCVSVPLDKARYEFSRGQYQEAVDILSSNDIRSKDRLLALMEKGLIQHQAGNYADSSKTFLQASDLLASTDFISVSEQGSSLLINDRTTTYRGEYAERLWIHTYQMMNFLLLDNAESAAVEARQALKLFDSFGDTLEKDWFTRALIAVTFDSAGLPNDAYIEYRKLAELMPSPQPLASILYRRARQLGFTDDANHYKELAGSPLPERIQDGSELILFVADGNIPRKRSGDLYIYPDVRISFPYYPPGAERLHGVSIESNGAVLPQVSVSTNLGSVARTSLAARGKKIAAKQAARVASKHAIVKAAESESETGAAVLNALLFILEMADTRGWETLPANLSVVRVPLSPGTHEITVADNSFGSPDGSGQSSTFVINVKPGQKLYRNVRF